MSQTFKELQVKYYLLLLSCGVSALLCSATRVSAANPYVVPGNGGGGYTSQSASFQNRLQSYFTPNPHQGTEEAAIQHQTEAGQDVPDQYQPNKYAEMIPSGNEVNATGPVGPTSAQQAQPKQVDAHDAEQKEFTVYPNPLQNNFGPPTGVPYHHWPIWLGAPTMYGGGLNPAFTKDLPPSTTKGAPPSDLVSNMSSLTAAKRQADQMLTTDFHSAQAQAQSQMQSAGEAAHAATGAQAGSNLQVVQTNLINVANENAGAPWAKGPKTIPQAIWMVQQMYTHVFIPLSVLLLLPGAVLSQVFATVSGSGLVNANEESVSPFTGILRAVVALFLIPATQVILSYGIDIGNSSASEITQFIDAGAVINWINPMVNPYDGMTPMQKENAQLDQTTSESLMDTGLGTIQMLLGNALMVLVAYQVVLACYLFLFGPIAATFLAWPASVGNLFKPVFSNWLSGVISLVMWRFWWCVIVLVMTLRLQWLQELGQPTNGPWEKLVFTAFTVMLAYVPFCAFDFRPGDLVDQLLAKTNGGKGD
jgi:hypothetical protein